MVSDNRRFEEPIPEGVEKRDAKLIGITGWYSQTVENNGIAGSFAFGGYFRYDVLDELVVDGQLVDVWGSSAIEGRMDEKKLEFVKVYNGMAYPIWYKFEKQNGIWVGGYESPVVGSGRSNCRTFISDEDAFEIVCGHV